ncbi:MAG: M15 family metallopeptidase [Terracidiphilus sp.]|nr:M15 family metallopeptidase [Terracidiphilus sp.]
MTILSKTLDFSNLGQVSLRMGDNDAQHRWGGQLHHGVTGNPVRQLQAALVAVGTLNATDGAFGHDTETALKRFQWYGDHMDYRLKLAPGTVPASGMIVPYSMSATGVRGVCGQALAAELIAWRGGNFVTTTPLVRLNVAGLSNVEPSDTFTTLSYPSAQNNEILVHGDFAEVVSSTMDDEAKRAKVILDINQAFRVAGIQPSGAVVPPAKKSQHLVGHAVDLNIVDGETTNTAAMFKNGTETDAADTFIEAVKKSMRWGGDFSPADPVHFDDYLDPTGEDYGMNYFFAQHCFHAMHPMRLVT